MHFNDLRISGGVFCLWSCTTGQTPLNEKWLDGQSQRLFRPYLQEKQQVLWLVLSQAPFPQYRYDHVIGNKGNRILENNQY